MSTARDFPEGQKFEVIREGARLSGWKPDGPSAFRGWAVDLHVGDVIESRGFGAGWGSDPGYGVHWRVDGINSVEFKPSGSGSWFTYWPADGYLREVPSHRPTRIAGLDRAEV